MNIQPNISEVVGRRELRWFRHWKRMGSDIIRAVILKCNAKGERGSPGNN